MWFVLLGLSHWSAWISFNSKSNAVPPPLPEFNDKFNYGFATAAIIHSTLESDNYSPKEVEQLHERGANSKFTI